MSNILFKGKRDSLLILIAFAIIFFLGVYLRIMWIGRNLEYDEIWTLLNYSLKPVSEIFTKLSTPNNHPINSLLIKYSVAVFGFDVIALRIPALISGVFLLILTPALTFHLFRNKFASLASMLLCALSPGLVYYSQIGRGYELQSLLILLVVFFIVLLEKRIMNSSLVVSAILLTGIVSILTIPTSILFLFPIILSHIFFLFFEIEKRINFRTQTLRFLRTNSHIITAYFALFVFCLLWFGINYHQFKAGQSYGTSVTSIGELLKFTCFTLLALASLPVLLFSLFSWIDKTNRWLFLSFIFFIIFPFAGAIIFKQGPARVYLPLIPIIYVFASIGLADILRCLLKNKLLLYIYLCLRCILFIR